MAHAGPMLSNCFVTTFTTVAMYQKGHFQKLVSFPFWNISNWRFYDLDHFDNIFVYLYRLKCASIVSKSIAYTKVNKIIAQKCTTFWHISAQRFSTKMMINIFSKRCSIPKRSLNWNFALWRKYLLTYLYVDRGFREQHFCFVS